MSLAAGKLNHRLRLERLEISQDSAGDTVEEWVLVDTLWASIEPLSAREFIASRSPQSEMTTRIGIRHRAEVDASMRLVHGLDCCTTYGEQVFNIEGVLPDKQSGLEYLTLPCSEGVNAG